MRYPAKAGQAECPRLHVGQAECPGQRGASLMPSSEEHLTIPVGSSWVNAIVSVKMSPVVVIATHPWGPMGGSMYDPHPTTACRLMEEAGCSVARFNFRGGINRGSSSVMDVKAVADWFTKPVDGRGPLASQVLLVGYSYGSMIAAAAAAEIPECIGYALLGPPLAYGWAVYLFNQGWLCQQAAESAGKPKLLMIGTDDVFCGVDQFRSFAETLPDPKTIVVKNGLDHFSLFRALPQALTEWIVTSFGVTSLESFAERGAQGNTTSSGPTRA